MLAAAIGKFKGPLAVLGLKSGSGKMQMVLEERIVIAALPFEQDRVPYRQRRAEAQMQVGLHIGVESARASARVVARLWRRLAFDCVR